MRKRRGGGFFISNYNGLRGLLLSLAPSDSVFAGRAEIWRADPLAHDTLASLGQPWRDDQRKALRTVATARLRAVRIGCDSVTA